MTLHIKETYFNETRGWEYGCSGWYEPYTDNIGRLFRYMQKEHCRCVSKVYIDGPDGVSCPVGWVFEKRVQYDDCNKLFTRSVWVEYKF